MRTRPYPGDYAQPTGARSDAEPATTDAAIAALTEAIRELTARVAVLAERQTPWPDYLTTREALLYCKTLGWPCCAATLRKRAQAGLVQRLPGGRYDRRSLATMIASSPLPGGRCKVAVSSSLVPGPAGSARRSRDTSFEFPWQRRML